MEVLELDKDYIALKSLVRNSKIDIFSGSGTTRKTVPDIRSIGSVEERSRIADDGACSHKGFPAAKAVPISKAAD